MGMGNSTNKNRDDEGLNSKQENHPGLVQTRCSLIELPSELLDLILRRVDVQTLCRSCTLICKLLHSFLAPMSDFWYRKALHDGAFLPSFAVDDQLVERLNFRRICMKKPFERNLVMNPSGEDGLVQWTFVHGGDGIRVERPPAGSNVQGFPVCFAASFQRCSKMQIIDLYKEGCDSAVLDELQPTITASEWYAARVDCACVYELRVMLCKSYRQHQRLSNRNEGESLSFDNLVVKTTGPLHTEQWVGGTWQEIVYRVDKQSCVNTPDGNLTKRLLRLSRVNLRGLIALECASDKIRYAHYVAKKKGPSVGSRQPSQGMSSQGIYAVMGKNLPSSLYICLHYQTLAKYIQFCQRLDGKAMYLVAVQRSDKVNLCFDSYPAGVRYVVFLSTGKDSQFWAGHYGPKMAKASVTLTLKKS